jgi:hypothetical protein
VTFLGTKSRKVENDSARWWRRQTLRTFNVVEGTISGEVAMHFKEPCEGLELACCSIMPRPEPQPFTSAMPAQLQNNLTIIPRHTT